MDDPTFSPPILPGFRLAKVQIMNWGTFDSSKGQIHTVRPDGRTALLIGQNGSGKSTMVDSILTLLVRPGIRNYNVAAGSTGRKKERDERSYLMGAYGHASSDGENKASTLYLRKEGRHLSVLLGYFHNAQTDKGFTMAQVLYAGADGKVEKVFCFGKGEKDIAEDFADIKAVDQIGPKLEARGIKTTKTYVQYSKWLIAETKMRGKAMDVFNQTVAVKDIRSLTEFIRAHMLESQNWKDRIEDILNHFQQLSDAHRMLVDAREQLEALQPVATAGADYQHLKAELEKQEGIERACESYFRTQTVTLFTRAQERLEVDSEALTRDLTGLGTQIDEADDQIRRLKNDIDNAGGERLRSLPFLIQQKEADSKQRRTRAERFGKALSRAGFSDPTIRDASAFDTTATQLSQLRTEVETALETADETRLNNALKAHELNQKREGLEQEIAALSQRSSNLPESHLNLRKKLCQDLHLNFSELPFAAELIAVRPEEEAWKSATEKVLRGFGLSLLIPADKYRDVSAYLDRTRLEDGEGKGQRLVYHRAGEISDQAAERVKESGSKNLLAKLEFEQDHALGTWARAEVALRYNYHCCADIEEFLDHRSMALMADCHVKSGPTRHEKDDRDHLIDARNYILGWDNSAKIDMLEDDLAAVTMEIQRAMVESEQHSEHVTALQEQRNAIEQALEVRIFTEIDYAAPDREISDLLREKEDLESSDQHVATLTSQLTVATRQKKELKKSESAATKRLGVLEQETAQAVELVHTASGLLQITPANPGDFPAIEAELARKEIRLSAENLFEQETAYMKELRGAIGKLRTRISPIEKSLRHSMSKFLRKFRNFEHELQEDPSYLGDFIALYDRLEHEDLPRHEQRFKDRLNEKVTTELGILNNQLSNEREEILTRIETLNRCLETIDYDRTNATFMQLEPKPVRDKEIEEFQKLLKDCLADAFDGSFETDEVRFKKIEGLIDRLRDEPRWREKVTDVRRWFDFGARETVRATGEEKGYYSDSAGQSGGEKAKLAFTILVAAVVYQFDIDPEEEQSDKFHFVVVDEMFSKIDDRYAEYALRLFEKFGLQLLIVAPFDAKAKITEPFVDYYMQVVKKNNRSRVLTMTSGEFNEKFGGGGGATAAAKPKRGMTPVVEPASEVVAIPDPPLDRMGPPTVDVPLNS